MELKLAGKRALVTGSSSGIGAAIATTLAQEGVTVVIHGRNRERAQSVADKIATEGGKAIVAIADLSTIEGATAVVEQSIQAFGGIDILVNNAGGTDWEFSNWKSASLEEWEALFQQNFFSALRLIHAFIPHMQTLGWGRIINIATIWAIQPGLGMPHYAAAKAALVNSTVSLAQELAHTGITVNTVTPGPILTPPVEQNMRDLALQYDWSDDWVDIERNYITQILPLSVNRIGYGSDIANAVAFLASPLADFIDGINLRVDGGYIKSIH
ncbi:putative 3-oxoacyl-(acyl carrier protein) reductase [Nostoc sp. NIES-4103]|nr:putative 3-oxoacyl-(acyl carrier protein) reductase [Nostoc sp. NIES-4103]